MEFIEIKEGLSVKIDCIESIQRNEEGGALVTMESGISHDTTFPYIQLLQMLEIESNINHEPKQELGI